MNPQAREQPARFSSDTARWRAVRTRSASADRHFVYAVRTTRVFCRPSCASRLPRRENVEFFDTAGSARDAGYRPCKRCRPATAPVDEGMALVQEACRRLRAEERMTTRDVARGLGLSPSYFQRVFKKRLGVTPQQFRRRVLAERGRDALGRSASVTESVYEAGYSSSSRFYDSVAPELGMKPAAARAGAPGELLRYATVESSLGWLLIAWTERGVCQVGFADKPAELVAALRRTFPKARLEPSGRTPWVDAIVAAVETSTPADIPLDLRGTVFQERVWQLLREIPSGTTRTYKDLAEALGNPKGVRAVAGAIARNPLAVVVPCHRVIRSDGSLAGYRWGAARKRELLRRES